MDFNVAVKSKRKKERMRKRERALEKAEKTASALASAPPVPKPKKLQIMRTPSDPIRSYLRDIKRTKLLSASEEVALSRKIQVRTLVPCFSLKFCCLILRLRFLESFRWMLHFMSMQSYEAALRLVFRIF